MRTDLAPDFTLFMPLTNQAVGIYQANVPAVGGDRPEEGEVPPPPGNIAATDAATVRSPLRSGSADLESGLGGGSVSSGNRSRATPGSPQEGVEMAPTYHDPEESLQAPATGSFRKALIGSNLLGGNATRRGEYARLDSSVHSAGEGRPSDHGSIEVEGEEEED